MPCALVNSSDILEKLKQKLFQRISNCLYTDIVSYPRRVESSILRLLT